jgi:hypothetical protein
VVGEGLATELRRRLFASMLNQDVAFFDSHMTGEIVSRLTADVQEFKSAFKQVNNWLNNYLVDKLKVSKNMFFFSGSVRRPKVNKSSPRLRCQSVPHFPRNDANGAGHRSSDYFDWLRIRTGTESVE